MAFARPRGFDIAPPPESVKDSRHPRINDLLWLVVSEYGGFENYQTWDVINSIMNVHECAVTKNKDSIQLPRHK